MTDSTSYPPVPIRCFELESGERCVHSFRLDSWRWRLEGGEPIRVSWLAHFTTKRFLLEPSTAESRDEPIAIPWNDIIEFEFAEGSLAQQRIAGIDDFMVHCSTKETVLDDASEVFLFTCAPVLPDRIQDPRVHGQAFIELADDRMLEAFE